MSPLLPLKGDSVFPAGPYKSVISNCRSLAVVPERKQTGAQVIVGWENTGDYTDGSRDCLVKSGFRSGYRFSKAIAYSSE